MIHGAHSTASSRRARELEEGAAKGNSADFHRETRPKMMQSNCDSKRVANKLNCNECPCSDYFVSFCDSPPPNRLRGAGQGAANLYSILVPYDAL